jgi:hypothetical protein
MGSYCENIETGIEISPVNFLDVGRPADPG